MNPQREVDPEVCARLVQLPWALRVDDASMIVRPSSAADLAGTAVMHHRCSARSLLGRYQLGGRPPTVLALDQQLRSPLTYVVTMRDGKTAGCAVIATATIGADPDHGSESARTAILVEDSWQRMGLGRELLRHLAGVAAVTGHRIITYPGLLSEAVQRMVIAIGTTRMVSGQNGSHLHTSLPANAVGGLGPTRAGLLPGRPGSAGSSQLTAILRARSAFR